MKKIYLIRHCRAYGQAETADLTEEGKLQAKELAEALKPKDIQYIVSSPYVRAMETIAPFATEAGIPVVADERLIERILADEPLDDWYERLKATFTDLNLSYPGGESSQEAMSRGVAVIESIMGRTESSAAVVTHGCLLALILKHFNQDLGFADWEKLTNPDVYELNIEGRKVNIKRLLH
ncbi:2,3-bisphosphoglycerate-dependent phosphoglycerate mutase [Scopulibacillus darangshiensis]|uniref:2,3-bisphosphoglycerate-dependent phosphoglycerate mutase n=1 Tax=Scopulibacillus darangshiensis TaxID=442528 RepID=A0A4R2P8R1_9BACL|nr:histidine phosphatase family protein [Scopulibacillus darangshiensis]TCP31272.1 2,3-bisphosphoglycerate-dependent phosphoglycerate mutase [Scopulibacillus darangshiensis]